VHQLPSEPSNIRVRVWRRLQQLGALVVKQAVYVLPDSAEAREDFEWLKTEIEGAGGQAAVFTAHHVDSHSDPRLVEEFRRARQGDYTQLAQELEKLLAGRRSAASKRSPGHRRDRSPLQTFRQRLAAIEHVDFFGSAGRDRVVTLIDQLAAPHPAAGTAERARDDGARDGFRHRVWATRARPGVDRMSSAWLIRRFIDPGARFVFVQDDETPRADCVPFDMFGVEFSHRGSHCTFETLCEVFGIGGRAITRIAAIVHDLDLKDGKFGAAEAPTVGALIEGLQLAHVEDAALLEQGMMLFESLYRAFDRPAKRAGPRAVARPRATAHKRGNRKSRT
jgi:hypothetical protein